MKRIVLVIALLLPVSIYAGGLMMSSGTVVVAAGGCNDTLQDKIDTTINGTNPAMQQASTLYQASMFTPSSTYTVCSAKVILQRVGSPTFNIFAAVYSSTGSTEPNTVIATSDSIAASALTTAAPSWSTPDSIITFSNINASLTSGTNYWVVLYGSTFGDTSNEIKVAYQTGVTGFDWMRDDDGTAPWSLVAADYSFHYRLYD